MADAFTFRTVRHPRYSGGGGVRMGEKTELWRQVRAVIRLWRGEQSGSQSGMRPSEAQAGEDGCGRVRLGLEQKDVTVWVKVSS